VTDAEKFLDLVDRYREKFGDAPPIHWADPPEKHAWHIKMMEQALETGEPWVRSEFENIPEGILI
jgi:hypothetical protein